MGLCGATKLWLQQGWRSMFREQELGFCDGIRALAVLWVCSLHATQSAVGIDDNNEHGHLDHFWMVVIPLAGGWGVDVFFVLSGFLLGGALHREMRVKGRMAIGKFFVRRFFRIYPTLLVTAWVLSPLADLAYRGVGGPFTCPNNRWWMNIYLLSNFIVWGEDNTCVAQAWSVSIELQMYVATPLLLGMAWGVAQLAGGERRPWLTPVRCVVAACALCLAACFAVRLQYVMANTLAQRHQDYYMRTQYRFGTYFCGVAAGALAVDWKARGKLEAKNGGGAAASMTFIACAMAIIGTPLLGDQMPNSVLATIAEHFPMAARLWIAITRPVFGVALAVLFLLCSCGCAPLVSGFLGAKAWRPIAALSYSMYLFQFVSYELVLRRLWAPTIGVLGDSLDNLTPRWQMSLVAWLYVLAFIIVDMPLSLLNHMCVERPCIELGRRLAACLGGRQRLASAPAAAQSAAQSAASADALGATPDDSRGGTPSTASGEAPCQRVPPASVADDFGDVEDKDAGAGAPPLHAGAHPVAV